MQYCSSAWDNHWKLSEDVTVLSFFKLPYLIKVTFTVFSYFLSHKYIL